MTTMTSSEGPLQRLGTIANDDCFVKIGSDFDADPQRTKSTNDKSMIIYKNKRLDWLSGNPVVPI